MKWLRDFLKEPAIIAGDWSISNGWLLLVATLIVGAIVGWLGLIFRS